MIRLIPILLLMIGAGDVKDDARKFLDLCQASKFEEACANFDAKMTAVLPPTKLSEIWTGLTKQLGPVTKFGEARVDAVEKSRRAKIRCDFKSVSLDALVSFNPEGKIEGFFLRPAEKADNAASTVKRADPPYVDPTKFTEEAITVGAEGWLLPGTITRPRGADKAPLLVLVHGSGPNDRDETIGPNTPFRDLAHGLATQGIAALRFDKRTLVHRDRLADPAVLQKLTVKEEVLDDVLATVAQARRLSGVDPERIFVLGHSQGGTLAPLIAQKDGRLAGIILLAASNRPPEDLIREQIDHIKQVDPDQAAALAKLDTALDDVLARMKTGRARDDETVLGASVRYWKSLGEVQSAKLAGSLQDLPVLVLQGGRDYQVTEVDFDAFRQALKGRPDTEFHLYPDLNHCFQKGQGKATPAEYLKPAIVDERVIKDIARWVRSIR